MAENSLSFMEMVEILVMNIHFLKTKNWIQFKQSVRFMISWLHIYDKVHYGKWLPEFWSEMINLPHEIDVHMPSIFSHSITGKPYSSIPTDLWIEMTMNKSSKMKAGWQRFLAKEKMLSAYIRGRNYINKLGATLHNICNMKAYDLGHKKNISTRLRAYELGVPDINSCIAEFN